MTDSFALESAKIHAVKTIVSLSPWSRSLVEPWSLHLSPLGTETSRTCVGEARRRSASGWSIRSLSFAAVRTLSRLRNVR